MYDYEENKYVDPKEERSYESRIWWALILVGLLVLAFSLYQSVKSFDLYKNGSCIEVDFEEGSTSAFYTDENGKLYSFNITGYSLNVNDGKLKLYYKDKIANATPINSAKTWIMGYGISLILIGLSIYKIRKIYKSPDYR